jgi:hypothetical protein
MMDVHNQLGFSLFNAYWIVDILRNIIRSNINTILIAQNGNFTVSWPLSNQINTNRLRYLKNEILTLKFHIGIWKKEYIFSKYLLKSIALKEKIKKAKVFYYFKNNYNNLQIRNLILKPGNSNLGDFWYENGLFNKLEIRDPTIDKELIAFLFGIPKNSNLINQRILFNNNFKNFYNQDFLMGKLKGIQGIDIKMRIKNDYQIYKKRISESNQYTSTIKNIETQPIKKNLQRFMINLFLERIYEYPNEASEC